MAHPLGWIKGRWVKSRANGEFRQRPVPLLCHPIDATPDLLMRIHRPLRLTRHEVIIAIQMHEAKRNPNGFLYFWDIERGAPSLGKPRLGTSTHRARDRGSF